MVDVSHKYSKPSPNSVAVKISLVHSPTRFNASRNTELMAGSILYSIPLVGFRVGLARVRLVKATRLQA